MFTICKSIAKFCANLLEKKVESGHPYKRDYYKRYVLAAYGHMEAKEM